MEVHGLIGKPLTLLVRDELGHTVGIDSTMPLAKADKVPLSGSRLKAQLGRVGVAMTEVDIERDLAAAEFVMSVNGGNQTVPTLLFADGSTMVNPSAGQVQARLAELAAAQAR